jgi:hypothetical protein
MAMTGETRRLVNGRIVNVTPGKQNVTEHISDAQRLSRYKGMRNDAHIEKGGNPEDLRSKK